MMLMRWKRKLTDSDGNYYFPIAENIECRAREPICFISHQPSHCQKVVSAIDIRSAQQNRVVNMSTVHVHPWLDWHIEIEALTSVISSLPHGQKKELRIGSQPSKSK